MIELIATVESLTQAQNLLSAGADALYFGEDFFGLRLPYSFSREEQAALVAMCHQANKKAIVAVNAIFHNDGIEKVADYLRFLKEIEVDQITVGDPGVVQVMKTQSLWIPYRYDAQVMVTNSRQVNFWAKRGAVGAVMARELPEATLRKIAANVEVPIEVQVYGATCIHQSRRPLLQNYFSYIKQTGQVGKDRGYFLSEPMKPNTHYSIYEDANGTHIFANNDICLMDKLSDLVGMPLTQWKLDGIFTPDQAFVEIVRLFGQARDLIAIGQWDIHQATLLGEKIRQYHPQHRGLDHGFYVLEPEMVK